MTLQFLVFFRGGGLPCLWFCGLARRFDDVKSSPLLPQGLVGNSEGVALAAHSASLRSTAFASNSADSLFEKPPLLCPGPSGWTVIEVACRLLRQVAT